MKVVAAAVLAALLSGCSLNLPTLFRVPVLQGNVVDADKVQQLEEGMTPPQVRYLLGTPLIDNNFDGRRWDYVFYFRDRNANVQKSQLSLFFENEMLARIEGAEAYQTTTPEEARELDVEELNETPPSNERVPTTVPPTTDPQPGPPNNPGTADL